jgi:hypothetical protein
MRLKQAGSGSSYIMPHHPAPKISKDRSFRSEEVLSGIQPGIHSSLVEGMETLERIIINSHPESCERVQGGNAKTDKSDSAKKTGIQKPSDGSVPNDDLVAVKTTDTDSNTEVSGAVQNPADALKETPKSTVKKLKSGRARSSVKKRVMLRSCSKRKEKETIHEEKNVCELVPSIESKNNRGQRTPVRSKTPVTPSVQGVVTPVPKSERKGNSDAIIRNFPGSAVLCGSHLRPGMLNVYLLECLEHD